MRLAARVWGDGPLRIALVHGHAGSAELWTEVAEPLAARLGATLTAVDLRGHGATGPAASYRLDDLAGDLVESLPTGLDAVIGHSLGGRAVAEAAGRLAPRRIVLLDPVLSIPLAGTRIGRRLVGSAPVARLVAWQFGRVTGLAGAQRRRYERAAADWDRATTPVVVRETLEPFRIGPPAVPTRVVVPRRSVYVPSPVRRRLAAAGWEVEVLPGVAHDLPGRHPALTVEAIARAIEGA